MSKGIPPFDSALLEALGKLGLNVDLLQRVVIDIQAGHLVTIYTEQIASPAVLEVVQTLDGTQVSWIQSPAAAGDTEEEGK